MIKKQRKSKVLGPIVVIGIIILILMILSLLLSVIGFDGQVPNIVNNNLEMNLVTVKNIFSIEGIKYFLSSSVVNFRLLEPIVLLIMSLIALSIAESSGLLKHISKPFAKLSTKYLIFFTLVISVIFTLFGDYSFILLLPLIGIIYKYVGRNPMLGILTVFIGITCSYGTGIIYNYNTYLLGTITQLSASIKVDSTFNYDVLSCCYIMIFSACLFVLLGTYIINKYLAPHFKKVESESDELKLSNKALWYTNIVVLVVLILVTLMIIPGGLLLNNDEPTYIAKLLGNNSPFKDAFIFIIVLTTMLCGAVYGKISGNIKNRLEYNVGLYKSFNNVGYVFVLMFFASIMMGVLNWTNIGTVIAAKIVNLISMLPFTGGLLIVIFFVFSVLIGILIPDIYTKWNMIAPLIVPLFMRANIAPEFTQFIFGISDGIAKSISPFYFYFIIALGLLQKYNDDNKKEITIFGTIKQILPIVMIFAGIWLVLIVSWNIIGLPLGIETFATL